VNEREKMKEEKRAQLVEEKTMKMKECEGGVLEQISG